MTLGDTAFHAISGHLFEAEVAVTAEIYLDAKEQAIFRKYDDGVGLNFLDLDFQANS